MPSLTSCVMKGLLLVVTSVASCWLVLHGVMLCPSSSPPPRHTPWGVLACARVSGCWMSFVTYCCPPIIVSHCHCLSHCAVVISLPMLLSFPSLPFPHPRRPHRSPFPPHEQLLMAVVGGVMWWWLSSWPPHRHIIICTLLIRSPGTLQPHPVPRQCPHILILQGGGQSGHTQLLLS